MFLWKIRDQNQILWIIHISFITIIMMMMSSETVTAWLCLARQESRDLSTRAKTIHSFEYALILAVFIVVYL